MNVHLTVDDLVSFEEEIAAAFLDRQIRAPIHLSGGNERQLIEIFKRHVEPDDWILCSWRSHLHCLLKGVPRWELKQAILDGKSITLCFPQYKILSSAIVGGIAPIAVGLAMGIKRKQENRRVTCFLGDMTAETGIVHESVKYSENHGLPVTWVVEDNGLSVGTPTGFVWSDHLSLKGKDVVHYIYTNKYPHVGCGKHVVF